MGYYTSFKISTEGKPYDTAELEAINNLKKEANKLSPELKAVALEGIKAKEGKQLWWCPSKNIEAVITAAIGHNPFSEQCKWYEHEEDMRKISKEYPQTIFILEGEGEESGDLWKEYYVNGKMQRCKAEFIFPEFDEKKLK